MGSAHRSLPREVGPGIVARMSREASNPLTHDYHAVLEAYP